jgi:hypothetical protein
MFARLQTASGSLTEGTWTKPGRVVRPAVRLDARDGRRRTAALAMLAATGLYLLFEVPFGSLVLDVVGSSATSAEIERLEWTGRVFTALAVLIVVWGTLFDRYVEGVADMRRTVVSLVVAAVLVVPVVHQAVWYGVEAFVASSSPAARQRAANAQLLRTELFSAKPRIAGLPVEPGVLSRPEWKAFAAAAPLVGIAEPRALASLAPSFQALLRRNVEERMGGPEEFRRKEFEPALAELHKAFDGYRDGVKARADALGSLGQEADRRWKSWHDFMLKVSNPPMSFSPADVRNLRAKLATQGLRMSDDQDPRSERDFRRAVIGDAGKPAEAAFDARVRDALGADGVLPRDIDSFERFAAQAPVQARIKSLLGMAEGGAAIPVDAEGAAFEKGVYRPAVDAVQRRLSASYLGDPATFADGRTDGQLGRDVFRASLVPPVALVLSLLGILVHTFKFSNYALILRSLGRPGNAGRSRRGRHVRIVLGICVVLAALVAIAPATTRLTGSEFVATADADAARSLPWLPFAAVSGPIRAEAAIYPVKHALAGLPHFALVAAVVRAAGSR